MKELDIVTLKEDLPELNLKAGATGTVINIYKDGQAYEVEFTEDDKTIVATLPSSKVKKSN